MLLIALTDFLTVYYYFFLFSLQFSFYVFFYCTYSLRYFKTIPSTWCNWLSFFLHFFTCTLPHSYVCTNVCIKECMCFSFFLRVFVCAPVWPICVQLWTLESNCLHLRDTMLASILLRVCVCACVECAPRCSLTLATSTLHISHHHFVSLRSLLVFVTIWTAITFAPVNFWVVQNPTTSFNFIILGTLARQKMLVSFDFFFF